MIGKFRWITRHIRGCRYRRRSILPNHLRRRRSDSGSIDQRSVSPSGTIPYWELLHQLQLLAA